jgi:hypothetical protein
LVLVPFLVSELLKILLPEKKQNSTLGLCLLGNPLFEANNFCLGAFFLLCLGSELQEPPLAGYKRKTVLRVCGLVSVISSSKRKSLVLDYFFYRA